MNEVKKLQYSNEAPKNPMSFWMRRAGEIVLIADQVALTDKFSVLKNFKSRFNERLKQCKPIEEKLSVIQRVDNISSETFHKDFSSQNCPVIFSSKASAWNCKDINFSWLEEKLGGQNVTDMVNGIETTVSDVVENIRKGGTAGIKFDSILSRNGAADLIDLIWLQQYESDLATQRGVQLFVSGKDQFTYMHSAGCGNFFVQVHGRKKWWIYPHWNTPFMTTTNQSGGFRETHHLPFVDEKDEALFRLAQGYYAELEPGDVLWVPPYSWHFVYNIDASIGIAYKWVSRLSTLRVAPLLTLIDFFEDKTSLVERLRHFIQSQRDKSVDIGKSEGVFSKIRNELKQGTRPF